MNTQFLTYAKRNINLYLAFISVLILFFTYSCKDEASMLGADLLPDDDKIELIIDTTLTFNGFLLDKEEYSTKYYSSLYLGQINDPYFGKTTASIATQYYLTSTSVTFDEVVNSVALYTIVDSVVMYLEIDSIYGDFDTSKDVMVYTISNSLSSDSSYLTTTPITNFFDTENLISTETTYQGDTLVRVKLSNAFASSLVLPLDSIYYYRTVEKFLEKYKGIAINYDETTETGGLLKLSMSSTNSEIKLFYKKLNDENTLDTLTLSYKFSSGVKYNNIQYDYSLGIIQNYIDNDTTENDSLLFVQGLGGMTNKLVFSNLSDLLEENIQYSILTAELFIPVLQDENINSFVPPSNLYFIYKSDTSYYQIEDYSSDGFFSGSYNETSQEYKFDISRHLKNLLNNQIEDSTLYIRILNSSSYPHRVILKTGENIKLKVTYTKH